MGFLKTLVYRKKRAEAVSLGSNLDKVTMMGFGDGGASDSNTPLPIPPDATDINNEIKRKTVTVAKIDDYTYSFTCSINSSTTDPEFLGTTINEVSLIDEGGDVLYVETFTELYPESIPTNFIANHTVILQFV